MSVFHALLALTYFVAFPVSQNFLANAAAGLTYGVSTDATFVLLINLSILVTSIGLAMMTNAFIGQLAPQKARISILPLVLEPTPIDTNESVAPSIAQTPETAPKKKVIIQF